jgi:hypothetical protein
MSIEKINQILEKNGGELPSFAWPGGYPLMYFDIEGEVMCAECATESLLDKEELPNFKPVDYNIYWEGPPIYCSECNAEIESAYGDPDAPENQETTCPACNCSNKGNAMGGLGKLIWFRCPHCGVDYNVEM